MGVVFEVRTAAIQELEDGLPPAALAIENARRKARAVAELAPGRWILGADTVVALEGRLFGKPSSPDQARAYLRALSGRTHEVVTGCCLCGPDGVHEVFHETTRVTFRALDDAAIDDYLARVHVLDKAGAYAIQEHGERIIAGIEGSRANVIGLPVERLEAVLVKHGLR